MAEWNSFSYICTTALDSFRSLIRAFLRSLYRHFSVAQCMSPSSQPFSQTSVSLVPTLHLLPPSTPFWPYDTHKFFPHAQTISILSDLLYSLTPFLFQLSYTHLFIPNSIHSRHYNQTSQTLHLANIHFPSLSTSHIPCLCYGIIITISIHCFVLYAILKNKLIRNKR